ncbi:MAG: copper chaperone [Ginsengibacter sp.]
MKKIRSFIILFISMIAFQFSFGQTSVKNETIIVNGNCGTCKKNIEKSALEAGAVTANWDKNTKFLNVSYDPSKSNSSKIQMAIAEGGYDTQDYKASDSSYNKLDDCCQYDRKDLKTPKKDQ